MAGSFFEHVRQDCLTACADQPDVRAGLARQHIAVTGGTGFLGTWVAETIAALNDEYKLGIILDLYARDIRDWPQQYPHLASRLDIRLRSQDVRSPFEFSKNTSFVIHAAGVPNNRVHASDPLRVFETTVSGIANVLEAASKLDGLRRIVNVSSCLVTGRSPQPGPLKETDSFAFGTGELHTVYGESKRAAETVAAIYRSQYRLPVSTVRPFTFAGPYQELDRPWALNSFLRDALTGREVRVHGDGSAKRSYLYGSDAAWWSLAALVRGEDGAVYNLGSPTAVSHLELVRLVCKQAHMGERYALNTLPSKQAKHDELYPDTALAEQVLGVKPTCELEGAIEKTYRWLVSKGRGSAVSQHCPIEFNSVR